MAEEADLEDKTEDPSQKRLDDALERGNVVKSQEVSTWFIIAGATLVLLSFSGGIGQGLTTTMRGLIANSYDINIDGPAIPMLFQKIGLEMLAALGVPFLLLMLAALAGNLVQHRLVWSTEALSPRLSKISPLAGLKRLFSKQALANLGKGIAKLLVVGTVMTVLMWPERDRMEGLVTMDPAALLPFAQAEALKIMGAVVALLAVIAAADYFFQYRSWFGKLKMSLQELKDEIKQTQGDPFIKGKLKQIRAMRAKQRMSSAVPKASVIITNPTHYAVALQYERGMDAPLCVAKGVDAMALQIRKIATEHDVPIVENPPLARALHATVEVDQAIPPEHYKAVAEVISYVMKLRRAVRH
ncbi:MAG: flagellar biosynthesis protein FlhB [Proteobacteria bacterium]|nr:flagellar biosynthesis protein FlhB [Pseudomonadota bacterium]